MKLRRVARWGCWVEWRAVRPAINRLELLHHSTPPSQERRGRQSQLRLRVRIHTHHGSPRIVAVKLLQHHLLNDIRRVLVLHCSILAIASPRAHRGPTIAGETKRPLIPCASQNATHSQQPARSPLPSSYPAQPACSGILPEASQLHVQRRLILRAVFVRLVVVSIVTRYFSLHCSCLPWALSGRRRFPSGPLAQRFLHRSFFVFDAHEGTAPSHETILRS